jgi:hypothetical protein
MFYVHERARYFDHTGCRKRHLTLDVSNDKYLVKWLLHHPVEIGTF